MLYNHTICLQNGGYPVKKQAIALLLAAVLVLSGCTTRGDVENYAYRPHYILDGVGCVAP